jgi:putative peptidoglycan lipid II flippase
MAGIIISVLAVPIVRLLFERGAFDRATTLQVGALIPWLFIGVLGMACTILLFRAYYAKGDIAGTAMMGVVGTILYFTLSGFLSNYKGLQGIIVAYAITWWTLLMWALMRLWGNNLNELLNSNNLTFLWQLTLTLGICGGLVSFGNTIFIQSAINADVVFLGLRLFLLASIGLILFLAVAVYGFKMSEVTSVLGLFPLARVNEKLN